jgi:hypothetical protein
VGSDGVEPSSYCRYEIAANVEYYSSFGICQVRLDPNLRLGSFILGRSEKLREESL